MAYSFSSSSSSSSSSSYYYYYYYYYYYDGRYTALHIAALFGSVDAVSTILEEDGAIMDDKEVRLVAVVVVAVVVVVVVVEA